MTADRWGLLGALAFIAIAAILGKVASPYDTGLLTQMLIYTVIPACRPWATPPISAWPPMSRRS
jgi:hypothetical protein